MYQFHTQEPESQQPKFIQKENLLDLGQNNQSAYLQASPKQRERLDEYIGFLLERDFIPRSKTHTELYYAYKALYPSSPPPDLIAELWVKVASMVQLKAETPPGWSWAGIEKNNEPAEDHCYARHPILWRDRLLKGVNQPLPLDNSAGFRDPCLQYGIQINPISDDMYYACCGLPLNHPGCWRGPKKNEIVPYLAFDLTDWNKKMPSGTRYIVYESDNAFYDQIEKQVEKLKQNVDLTSKTLTTQLKLNQILKLEAKYNRCAKERQVHLKYESEEEEEDLESEVPEEEEEVELPKGKDLESEDEVELSKGKDLESEDEIPTGKDKEEEVITLDKAKVLEVLNVIKNFTTDTLLEDYKVKNAEQVGQLEVLLTDYNFDAKLKGWDNLFKLSEKYYDMILAIMDTKDFDVMPPVDPTLYTLEQFERIKKLFNLFERAKLVNFDKDEYAKLYEIAKKQIRGIGTFTSEINITTDELLQDYISNNQAAILVLESLFAQWDTIDNWEKQFENVKQVYKNVLRIIDTRGKTAIERVEDLKDIKFTFDYEKLKALKDSLNVLLKVFTNPSNLLKIYIEENQAKIALLQSNAKRFIQELEVGNFVTAERIAELIEGSTNLINTIGELQNFKLPKEVNLSFYDPILDDALYKGVGIFKQLKKEYQLVQMIEKLNLAAPNLFTQDYPDKVKADLDALLMKMDETLAQFLIDNTKYKVEPADSDEVKDAKKRIQAEAVKKLINLEPLQIDPQLDQLVLQAGKKLTEEPGTWEQLLDEARKFKDVDDNTNTYYLRILLAINLSRKAKDIIDKTDVAILSKYLLESELSEIESMITNAYDILNVKPEEFGVEYRKGLIRASEIDISLFNTFNTRFIMYNFMIDGIDEIEKQQYNYDWPNGIDRDVSLNRRYDFQEKLKKAREKFGKINNNLPIKFKGLDGRLDDDIQAYIRDQVEENIFQGLFDKYLEPKYNIDDDRLNPFKAAYIRAKFGLDKTKTVAQAAKELKDEIERLRNLLANEIVLTNDEIPYVDLTEEQRSLVPSVVKLERVPEWFRYLNQSEQLRDAAEFYLDSLRKN